MGLEWRCELRFKAQAIAVDRRDCEPAVLAQVGHRAVVCVETAVDLDGVPLVRMSDVVDRDVIVLTPEERDRIEPFTVSEHIPRGYLALELDPDPDPKGQSNQRGTAGFGERSTQGNTLFVKTTTVF